MNPKEKAEELLKEFLPHAMFYIHDLTPPSKMKQEQKENAIECALICVKQIVEELYLYLDEDAVTFEYWNEVKDEILKL